MRLPSLRFPKTTFSKCKVPAWKNTVSVELGSYLNAFVKWLSNWTLLTFLLEVLYVSFAHCDLLKEKNVRTDFAAKKTKLNSINHATHPGSFLVYMVV